MKVYKTEAVLILEDLLDEISERGYNFVLTRNSIRIAPRVVRLNDCGSYKDFDGANEWEAARKAVIWILSKD